MMSDFHLHSSFSPDSSTPMTEMIAAADACGLDTVCFTDHCDLGFGNAIDLNALECGYHHALSLSGNAVDIRLGLELGDFLNCPLIAADIADSGIFDFIIGSVHSLRNKNDFYYMDYASMSTDNCHSLLSAYIAEYTDMADLNCFDVLGHLGYPLRYMHRAGKLLSISSFQSELETLFRAIIDSGRGIELNTSGFPDNPGFLPEPAVLAVYKKCGGEIITVGSDAHSPSNVGKAIREAHSLLKDSGFRYFTVYKNRIPAFVRIV